MLSTTQNIKNVKFGDFGLRLHFGDAARRTLKERNKERERQKSMQKKYPKKENASHPKWWKQEAGN